MENEAIFNNDRQPPLRGDNVLVGGCRRPQKKTVAGSVPASFHPSICLCTAITFSEMWQLFT